MLSGRREVTPRPAGRAWGAGAGVGISRLCAGLQAEPEGAGLRQALQSKPGQGPSRGRRGQQDSREAGPPRPSPPPQIPRVPRPRLPRRASPRPRTWRRHCGSDARERRRGRRRRGAGILREVPGPAARGRVLGPLPGAPRFSTLGKADCPSLQIRTRAQGNRF